MTPDRTAVNRATCTQQRSGTPLPARLGDVVEFHEIFWPEIFRGMLKKNSRCFYQVRNLCIHVYVEGGEVLVQDPDHWVPRYADQKNFWQSRKLKS